MNTEPIYEPIENSLGESGIQITYLNKPSFYAPPHWHHTLELIYPLNGEIEVIISGKKTLIRKKHLLVVDAGLVHSIRCINGIPMGIQAQISKSFMRHYVPDMELLHFVCGEDTIQDEQFPHYLHLCQLMADLMKLYVEGQKGYRMESDGILLQVLSGLVNYFSSPITDQLAVRDVKSLSRISLITEYTEQHYQSSISLQDAADVLCLNKDYFCRFFKENMGISYGEYLNRVRLTHIYQDLLYTDESIGYIMEQHGFHNQKLFNQKFREIYECTPSKLRSLAAEGGNRS